MYRIGEIWAKSWMEAGDCRWVNQNDEYPNPWGTGYCARNCARQCKIT